MNDRPAAHGAREAMGLRCVSDLNLRQPRLLRRAKPLLGTLVEIACAVPGQGHSGMCSGVNSAPSHGSPTRPCADAALAASEAGFAAVARVHRLMSRHEAASDVSRFNAAAPGQWTAVAPETLIVFAFVLQLSAQTGGIFDVCAACNEDGAGPTQTGQTLPGSWRDVEIDLQRGALRKHALLRADLGGVAKGYAVDAAVHAMQQVNGENIEGQIGWVNAGGDLRVFGDLEIPVRVRLPQNLSGTVACTSLRDRAAATSASYLACESPTPELLPGGRAQWPQLAPLPKVARPALLGQLAQLRHGISRQPVAHGKSWTVAAPHCMAADALTKLVAATGDVQHPLLAHYAAQAWIF